MMNGSLSFRLVIVNLENLSLMICVKSSSATNNYSIIFGRLYRIFFSLGKDTPFYLSEFVGIGPVHNRDELALRFGP